MHLPWGTAFDSGTWQPDDGVPSSSAFVYPLGLFRSSRFSRKTNGTPPAVLKNTIQFFQDAPQAGCTDDHLFFKNK
jgi:hypothetical protein